MSIVLKGVRTGSKLPIWSEVDGQDDIRWYEARYVKQMVDYKVTVQLANHKYSTGIYNVSSLLYQNDGSQNRCGRHTNKCYFVRT